MKPEIQARALRASQYCKEHGITQTEIAAAIGASQPQVSRVLNGEGTRASRLFEDVCLYVERMSQGVTAEAVRENDELIDAVRQTWDGSSIHARALATVIRSLSALTQSMQDNIHKGGC